MPELDANASTMLECALELGPKILLFSTSLRVRSRGGGLTSKLINHRYANSQTDTDNRCIANNYIHPNYSSQDVYERQTRYGQGNHLKLRCSWVKPSIVRFVSQFSLLDTRFVAVWLARFLRQLSPPADAVTNSGWTVEGKVKRQLRSNCSYIAYYPIISSVLTTFRYIGEDFPIY